MSPPEHGLITACITMSSGSSRGSSHARQEGSAADLAKRSKLPLISSSIDEAGDGPYRAPRRVRRDVRAASLSKFVGMG